MTVEEYRNLWTPWGCSRKRTPKVRPDESRVEVVDNQLEGHYVFTIDFETMQYTGTFYHWIPKLNAFWEPVEMFEPKTMMTRQGLLDCLENRQRDINVFNMYERYYRRYVDRKELLPKDHNADRATVRTRRGKPYKIYLQPVRAVCDDCPFEHFHSAFVKIERRGGETVLKQQFECADYEKGIELYKSALESLDPILMESML